MRKLKVEKGDKVWESFDEKSKRLYTAELFGGAISNAALKNDHEVMHFLATICSGKTWKRVYGKTKLRVLFLSRGARYGYGGVDRYGNPGVALPRKRFGRTVHTLLHEVSHALAGDGGHDTRFIGFLLELMEEYEGVNFANSFRQRLIEVKALKSRKSATRKTTDKRK